MVKKGKAKAASVPPKSAARRKTETEDAGAAGDGRVVIQVRVRRALRRLIKQLADDGDETVQTFILRILQEAGVPVTDNDLLDRRRGENRLLRGARHQASSDSKTDTAATAERSLTALLADALARGGNVQGCMATPGLGGCLVIVNMGAGCIPDAK